MVVGGNHYVFERTLGLRLEENMTVVYYEQRGCGRSEAPQDDGEYSINTLVEDLEELRKQLHVEDKFVRIFFWWTTLFRVCFEISEKC